MNLFRISFLLVLSVLFQVSTEAQDWVSYQSQGQINDLVDTGTELLMATNVGLVVMNKSTLEKTIFTTENSNLTSNHIESIVQSGNGNTWIGTYDLALMRFDGTDFQDLTIPQGDINPNTIELYDFEIAPNGDFWVGSSQGVFHRQGTNWSQYDEAEFGPFSFAIWDIEINNAGEVFIGDFFIHKFSNGVWSNISETTNLSSYLHAELFLSNSGDLYYIGDLDKIGRFDGVQWQEYDVDLNGSQIKGITEDANGEVYFQTLYDGLFKIINNTWTAVTDPQATAVNNKISYFYIDSDNKRWLNSNIHLSVNDNGNIQSTLITETTLETNNVSDIHKGANGHLYFTTASQNNFSVLAPDGTWSFLPYPDTFMEFEFKNDFLYLADNDIWIATNSGLHHYNGSQWSLNPLGSCSKLAMNGQGKMYVLTWDRVYIMENGIVIDEYNSNNSSLTTNILTCIGIDATDNLWIGSFTWASDNAIQKVSPDGTWTTYNGTDHPAIDHPTGDFHFDVNGNVWIPANNVGVIKFDGTTWTNPVQANISNLSNYNVNSIESDATGKVYFAHYDGVTTLFNGVWEELFIPDFSSNSSNDAIIQFDDANTLWWASSGNGVFSLSFGLTLSARILLEGAYDTNGMMRTDLTDLIPTVQPYNAAPWFYSGNESLSTIPNEMVDWVLVEARTGTPNLNGNPGTNVVGIRAAVLLENGNVVGTDGTSAVRFTNLVEGEDYYFAIRHRNHLPALTATPITASSSMSYDFTTSTSMAFGPEQQKTTLDGKAVLYAGDANSDNVIQVTDYDQWSADPAVLNAYETTDFNLDGVIQVTDYDQWFVNKAKLGIGEF